MNLMHRLIHRRFAWLVLAGAGLLAPSLALAVPYTIILKAGNPAVPLSGGCMAVGSFDFNKTVVGSFTVPSASMVLSGDCSAQLGLNTGTYTGPLMVNVSEVIARGESQGPNVVSITGTLTLNGAPVTGTTHRMTFSGGNTPQPAPVGVVTYRNAPSSGFGSNPGITGTYFVVNNVNLNAPEPGMVLLVVTALGAMLFARRKRHPFV